MLLDMENPNNNVPDVEVARAEADEKSECGIAFAVGVMTATLVGVCVLPVLFYCGHRTAASLGIRVVAFALLLLGIMGLVLAACCCAALVETLLCGNTEGKPQAEEEH